MIAVIFEVWQAQEERQRDLDLAAALRQELHAVDGFISVERFESLTEPGKLLSLSFWRDEAAVAAWRTGPRHRSTQAKVDVVPFDVVAEPEVSDHRALLLDVG